MPWSRNTSWRQGSILAPKDFQAAGLTVAPENTLAIAISHDCDIANDNLEAEPAVEFIFACRIEQQNGNYTHGKNPRILHLNYKQGKNTAFFDANSSKKVIVPKNLLETIEPDENYTLISSRQVLQSWLAARYRRHALPNSLVERLREVFKYISSWA